MENTRNRKFLYGKTTHPFDSKEWTTGKMEEFYLRIEFHKKEQGILQSIQTSFFTFLCTKNETKAISSIISTSSYLFAYGLNVI